MTTMPTPAAVATRTRLSAPAEAADEWPGAPNPGEGHALPDEMPGADGTRFLLRFLPARLLWAPAVDAWLREDDGQPIKIGRDDLRAERARRLDEQHETEPERRRGEQPEPSRSVRPGRRAAVTRKRARRRNDRRTQHELDTRSVVTSADAQTLSGGASPLGTPDYSHEETRP